MSDKQTIRDLRATLNVAFSQRETAEAALARLREAAEQAEQAAICGRFRALAGG